MSNNRRRLSVNILDRMDGLTLEDVGAAWGHQYVDRNENDENVEDEEDVVVIGGGENDDDEDLIGVVARIGLNETPLTMALSSGNFALAEKIISEVTDPEYLNDGPNAATPLNLVLSGRFSLRGQSRNLRLAKLLVEKGANPNLRIPDNDLETWSIFESPIEHLLKFYLALLKSFQAKCAAPELLHHHHYRMKYTDADLLDTLGLNNEDYNSQKLTSTVLIQQTKELLFFFFEHGADVNLQTYDSGRTLFHALLASEVTDMELVERMVTLGAIVNLTDVHGTTPFMDTITVKDPNRALSVYTELTNLGEKVLLNAQNCSGESALWRALFQGRIQIADHLLSEGASSFAQARVQEIRRRKIDVKSYFNYSPSLTLLPSLLSPLLFNSVAGKMARTNNSSFHYGSMNKVISNYVGPLVDRGWFITTQIQEAINSLIQVHTEFGHLTSESVFQPLSIIPLMFGGLSRGGGLRSLCIRAILQASLFTKEPETVIKMLERSDLAAKSVKLSKRRLIRKSSSTPVNMFSQADDSAVVLFEDSMSEPETMEAGGSQNRRGGRRNRNNRRRVDENWLLQQDPSYGDIPPPSESASSTEDLEIYTEHRLRVIRIHQMLQETDEMLERLQSEVDDGVAFEDRRGIDLDRECARVVSDLDRMTDNLTQLDPQLRVQNKSPMMTTTKSSSSSSSSSSDSTVFTLTSSSEDDDDGNEEDDWGGGAFSLRHTLKAGGDIDEIEACQELIVQMITPKLLSKSILVKMNIPPGLIPLFELEVARAQLGAEIFRHTSISCDRGCEGIDESDDEDDSSSSENDFGNDEHSSESSSSSSTSTPPSWGTLTDPSLTSTEYESCSSSKFDDDNTEDGTDREENEDDDWFETYVRDRVDPDVFNHSTNSESD